MGSEAGPPAAATIRPTSRLSGPWQMAIDDWLLDQRRPALRFYHWSRPTLSIGFHQRRLDPRWLLLAGAGRLDLVRRPSGGGAVLHAGGLTYALVWPTPPRQRAEAYRLACLWLQEGFAALGWPLGFGHAAARPGTDNCFASATVADLVHGHAGPAAGKRVGSAQLWRRGCLLQHGEILLDPPAELWEAVFAAPPPAIPTLGGLTAPDLEVVLLEAARRALPMALAGEPVPWSARELAAIAARLDRYRLGTEVSRASPEACMERTTWGSARPSG